MSLARAFTSARRNKHADAGPPSPMPNRSFSARRASGQKIKISAPVELISTTNMLSFTAPTIGSMSNSSSSSGDESDSSRPRSPTTYSPATSPDASMAASPPESPEPNHLSAYFPSRSNTGGHHSQKSRTIISDKPAVPQRALSHTASSHSLARKRSMSKMAPPSSIHMAPPLSARSSAGMFSPQGEHPFGAELEQVNELAEEFGISADVWDEEEQLLREKGLRKFRAEDYMLEIQGLWGGVFEDKLISTGPGWI